MTEESPKLSWLKVIAASLSGLLLFATLYLSLENQHQAQVLQSEIDELKVQNRILQYHIEQMPDTILVINNFIKK